MIRPVSSICASTARGIDVLPTATRALVVPKKLNCRKKHIRAVQGRTHVVELGTVVLILRHVQSSDTFALSTSMRRHLTLSSKVLHKAHMEINVYLMQDF